mmetsp:Transcript_14360/g.33533  ORF Transcript_14360/g.33533 Transcript_14360/m.33533 type:complete len:353 (-) Transcript_14360:1057-2115(-)
MPGGRGLLRGRTLGIVRLHSAAGRRPEQYHLLIVGVGAGVVVVGKVWCTKQGRDGCGHRRDLRSPRVAAGPIEHAAHHVLEVLVARHFASLRSHATRGAVHEVEGSSGVGKTRHVVPKRLRARPKRFIVFFTSVARSVRVSENLRGGRELFGGLHGKHTPTIHIQQGSLVGCKRVCKVQQPQDSPPTVNNVGRKALSTLPHALEDWDVLEGLLERQEALQLSILAQRRQQLALELVHAVESSGRLGGLEGVEKIGEALKHGRPCGHQLRRRRLESEHVGIQSEPHSQDAKGRQTTCKGCCCTNLEAERGSVQTNNARAERLGHSRGHSQCWTVLRRMDCRNTNHDDPQQVRI